MDVPGSHQSTYLFRHIFTEHLLCTRLLCYTLGPKKRSGIVPILEEYTLWSERQMGKQTIAIKHDSRIEVYLASSESRRLTW